jgi:hypothetical protein
MSKKVKIIKKFFLAVLVVVLFDIVTSPISAQLADSLSINISPPVSYLYLKPGAGVSAPIYLENQGRYTLSVQAQYVDFKPDQETGRIILQQKSDFPYLSIAGDKKKWGEEFIIRPGEDYTLPVTVALPADFPQGEYYLSVLFNVEQMLLSNYESGADTILSGLVASHLVIAVNLDEADRSQVVIKEFKLPKIVDSLMRIDFQILAKNIGLNAGPIRGKLTVSHWPSPKEQVYEFYPDMVLADSQRVVRGMTEEKLHELEILTEQEELIVAKGEDFLDLQSKFLEENLSTNFSYKKPFLFGAYDFRLELSDQEQVERVIALPFSIVTIFLFLPVCYRILQFLIQTSSKQAKNKKNKQ